MTDEDISEMIQRCIEEIEQLRRLVAELRPSAEAYAAITSILGLLPKQQQGYGEDLVWRLRKQVEELKPKAVVAVNGETEV